MGTMDKLVKALEALKVVQPPVSSEETATLKKKESILGKKEKISHCSTIADAICSSNIRSLSDFPKFLGFAMDTFFVCCDDEDSDVRLMSDECLNRTIKTLLDSHLGRIQVELYKEIKKDGAARSLRAALSRFADLCHLIKPQKCRPYTVNLLPCLAKICQRVNEELVQETLAVAVTKVMPVLGQFTNDKEIKMLLKAFLPNLTVHSATVRRAAATSLIAICKNSRRPSLFYSWLLSALFDSLLPVQDEHAVPVILGTLLCLRHLAPHLSESLRCPVIRGNLGAKQNEEDMAVTNEQMLKIYEIALYFTRHADHNVVTSTLETLHQLLKTAPRSLQQSLVSINGITKSSIYTSEAQKLNRARSESQNSVLPSQAQSIDESALEDDQDVYPQDKAEAEHRTISDDTSGESFDQSEESISMSMEGESEDVSEYSSIRIGKFVDDGMYSISTPGVHTSGTPRKVPPVLKKGASDERLLETEDEIWDHSNSTPSPGPKSEFKVGNIGMFTDPDVPLKYCTRLLCSSFLLTGARGMHMPDRNVRVSVKTLALSCLGDIFTLYPKAFFLDLHIADSVGAQGECQKVWDVLLYLSHSDPHLKGQSALMLGHFICNALREAGGWWDRWVTLHATEDAPSLEVLVQKLISVVRDNSSIASKLGLSGVKQCINTILQSANGFLAFTIFDALLSLKDNPYWLLRVELVDVIADIPFKIVHYFENKEATGGIPLPVVVHQDRLFHDILIPFLGDEDFRVRSATTSAIGRIIPNLFYPTDHPYQDPVIALAKESMSLYLDTTHHATPHSSLPLVHALVKPFSVQNAFPYCPIIEGALSRVINLLVTTLRTSTNKYLTFGCCHTLCMLSEMYLVTVYSQAWFTAFGEGKPVAKPCQGIFRQQTQPAASAPPPEACDSTGGQVADLFNHLVALLTHTSMALDLTAHQVALQLAGNLMCGTCYRYLQQNSKALESSVPDEEKLGILKGSYLIPVIEQLFVHLMRLLNIFSHILDDQVPVMSSNRPALPSLPNAPSLSPIKRKSKTKEETFLTSTATLKGSPSRILPDKNESERERVNSKHVGNIGHFSSAPLYMKLYEILKGSHTSYKISMDFQSSEKFCHLLKCGLDVMSQLLEIADSLEMGKHAEEILSYLRSVMTMESSSTVQCVRQLLKSLFGTNLISLFQESQPTQGSNRKPGRATRLPTNVAPGLYHSCITAPYTQFTHSLANKSRVGVASDGGDDELLSCLSWMKRSDKLSNLLKSGTKGDKANLAAHIRLFESVVIKALKQYTITSNVDLQCQVLDLLAQLVQLRVNYCLLDSDQVFIGFVMRQFEYIEEGQIMNASILIPRIFYFLVLLSYERYHSKAIISVPKVLQLCDGLIASGQPPDKYVIRALQPVVEDLFVLRGMNKMDQGKELDAQREVIISTLFKLVHYSQVLELFLLIINQSVKEGEDKWKKLSRQIVDVILPILARQQLHVDSQTQMEVLQKLLESVASSVFRPVDILLKALFAQPRDLTMNPNLHRWMCMVLVILRIIISQGKEEVVLSRLGDMGIGVNICRLGATVPPSKPPAHLNLNQEMDIARLDNSSDSVFARFLFQVVGVLAESINNVVYSSTLCCDDIAFLCQQMAHLLLYLMHMFQSGTFRRIATSAMGIVKSEANESESTAKNSSVYYSISDINNMFLKLGSSYPTLVIQWCNVLTLLNCDSQDFWPRILQPYSCSQSVSRVSLSKQSLEKNSCTLLPCNLDMVRRGGIILLCDYVCENPNDAEHMTWLIVNHVNDLIHLSLETTVQDFISAIHRNPAASGLLIQAINARCNDFSRPSFLKRALNCLESIHPSQSGSLLILLIDKFLSTHHVAVARKCDSLACRRVEILLSDTTENAMAQLPVDDIDKLLEVIKNAGIVKRHQHLVSLLERLRTSLSGVVSPSLVHPLAQGVIQVQDFDLNKEWFLKYVREQCFSSSAQTKECVLLLSQLKYEDALAIMVSKEFHLPVLEHCLALGAELTIAAEKTVLPRSNDPFLGITGNPESALYRAARSTILQHITHLVTLLPRTSKHQARLCELFVDDTFWEVLCHVVPAASCYLKTLKLLPGQKDVPTDSLEDIAALSIMCCEAMAWIMKPDLKVSTEMLHIFLDMLDTTLKNSSLSSVIGLPEHTSWVFSAVSAVHQLVCYLKRKQDIASVPFPVQSETSPSHEQHQARQACSQMAEMINWLESSSTKNADIPAFMAKPLKSVIRGLARVPLVNSFARTPPILWQLGWTPEFTGDYKTLVPPPPGEYLQDRDVLKQYIYRINLLGWISRQQFEETWMALLGVLSATPVDDVEGKEEDQERIRTSCLAVKSITSLLLQTILLPQPGNPQNSSFLVQPRDKPLAFLHTKCGKKLLAIRTPLHKAVQELLQQERNDDQLFNMNTERVATHCSYSLSQVSLEYLCAAAGMLDDNEDPDGSASSSSSPLSANLGGAASYHQREQSLAAAGLDIHSCLHFLLDLYSQWLSPQACPCTPLTLLTEVARSVVILSDIFMERAQFEWMLDTLLEVQRVHPAEDEIIAQYLIFGICKSAAVLGMEQDMLERLRKLLELSLKSTYLPTRISTLHGLLYLLEQGVGDEAFPLLPTASDYVLKNLDSTNMIKPSSQNEDHTLIMWTLAFYIIENYQEEISENDFSQKIFQLSLSLCGSSDEVTPPAVYLTVLHGLERLLVAEILTGKEADLLIKLTVERIRYGSPLRSLAALGVLLSCMYIGKSTNMWSSEPIPEITKDVDSASVDKQVDSELLIAAMERVTVLFDRIKRGYPFEAEVMCQVLPTFLMEFFPAQDVLNKIIGEFLSSQQPHPQLMARVMFEVFQHLHKQSMEELIQDWVLLSLSNFTQRSPIAMAMWSLTCFFISATSSQWLQALFPYVQNRMGKMEEQDRVLFCIAGLNFRNQLKDEEQRQAYFTTIRSVAHTDTPYADLMSCL